MDDRIRSLAHTLWRYHQLDHELAPADAIMVLCSHDVAVAERGIDPQKFILVQKPYMERRTYATFKQRWPEKDIAVTSPRASFDDYLNGYTNKALSSDDVIAIMVGDLQRIRVYAERGWQIPQEIPADVWQAYEQLVAAGYDKYLTS